MKPSHKEFLEALEALKVIRLYASFSEGEDMADIYAQSLKMHAKGIRHVPPKRQTNLYEFFNKKDN